MAIFGVCTLLCITQKPFSHIHAGTLEDCAFTGNTYKQVIRKKGSISFIKSIKDIKLFCCKAIEMKNRRENEEGCYTDCLLYTSDAADERSSVDLGGRRIIK